MVRSEARRVKSDIASAALVYGSANTPWMLAMPGHLGDHDHVIAGISPEAVPRPAPDSDRETSPLLLFPML